MYTEKQRSQILLIILLGMGLFIVWASKGIWMGILWSVILYSICRPIHIYLTVKKHFKNTLSTVLILFGTLALLITPIYIFSSMLFRKIGEYSNDPYIDELITKTKGVLFKYVHDSTEINTLIKNVQDFGVNLLKDFLNGTV